MIRTIADIFQHENLERSVLIGYYGGGNYGDELLLEVLMNLFSDRGVRSLTVTYQYPERYDTYHHEFGYKRVNNVANKTATLAAILKNKNIIIGGGGLWGLDVNPNILLLSGLLFVSRWVFRKRVYLLGVGYYNSTSRLGRLSAWLAGKSANCIVARDPETLQNFSKINKRTVMDRDIAWHIHNLNLEPYRSDFLAFNAARPIRGKTLFITLRQFKSNQRNDYARLVEACVAKNQKLNIVVALMEPKAVDPEGYRLIRSWQKRHARLQVMDFSYNPLLLFLYFRANQEHLALIAPQFHTILTAYLAGVPFLPIAYDNKVEQLLKNSMHMTPTHIKDLTEETLQAFIDGFTETTH